jgi:hypothetical protein
MRRADERELGSWRSTAKLLPLESKPQRLTLVRAIQNAADKPTIQSLLMPPWKAIQMIIHRNSLAREVRALKVRTRLKLFVRTLRVEGLHGSLPCNFSMTGESHVRRAV